MAIPGCVPEFTLDFTGQTGSFFKKMSRHSPVNSEAFKADGGIHITSRRWIQFLDGAEKIVQGHMEENGKVKILELARKYGFVVESCHDPIAYIQDLSKKPEFKKVLKGAPPENEQIDGFSISKEKKILFRDGITEEQKNFVIAHELSHHLLGHKGSVFYKTAGEFKKIHEKAEYNEEADKLAAILLMPHIYMQDLRDVPDNDIIATRFGVPEKAVIKRKEEIEKEIFEFGYSPAPLKK